MTNATYPPLHPASGVMLSSMTPDEFTASFPNESSYVEWKEGVSAQRIQKAVVAFSNANGGVLMIGVDDKGHVIGRPFDTGLEKKIWEIVSTVDSPGEIKIFGLVVGQVGITVLSIAPRRQGVALTSNGTALIRRGKQNLPLTGAALIELVTQRAQDSFDLGVSRWRLADADSELLAQLCDAYDIPSGTSEQDRSDALEERGMTVRHSGDAMLTKAGALFLVPSAPAEFGKCIVEVFRYPEQGAEYDQRVVFKGTPARQVDEATAWIDKELGFDLVVVGSNRHELKRLPVRALRETIANAVAHRDYQLSGSAVDIHISPHEVRVTSPGGFIAPITSENLRNAHAPRNRRIIQALRAFGLAEDAGRGIRVILGEMAEDLRSEPSFEEQPHGHVTVRLPIQSPVSPEERAWVRELEDRAELLAEDRRVLVEAARGKELTNGAVRSLLNVDSLQARRSLQRLRDAGLLLQDGEQRGARYRIASGLGHPAQLDSAAIRSAVLKLAANGPLTNATVRHAMGVSRGEALLVLRRLVLEGMLELKGSKRGSFYVLKKPT